MKQIIEILKSYRYDYVKRDHDVSFPVYFNTGTGVFVIFLMEKGLRFSLKLDISFDSIEKGKADKLFTLLNSALPKGLFELEEHGFIVYTLMIEERKNSLEIAKLIDQTLDLCDTYMNIFQMVLQGREIDVIMREILFETQGNA